MRGWVITTSVLWILVCAPPADAAPKKKNTALQLIVLGAKKNTKAEISLVPGDTVAHLTITNAPAGLIEKLRQQIGPIVHRVERIGEAAGKLQIALYLNKSSVVPRLRKLGKRRRAFALTFWPSAKPPPVQPKLLIGRVPDTPPRPPWPIPIPKSPRRTPCTRFPKVGRLLGMLRDQSPPSMAAISRFAETITDPQCQDFLMAHAAAHELTRDRAPDLISRWAYKFSNQDRWTAYGYAYSFTALVAASVLLRSDFGPEAEILLATDRIKKSRRLMPYRGLLMADLLVKSDPSTSIRLLRALTSAENPDDIRTAAVARLLDLTPTPDASATRALLDDYVPKATKSSALYNEVALRAGELAFSIDAYRRAKSYFAIPAKSPSRRVFGHAELRLGDLAVALDRKPSVALKHYHRVDQRELCLAAMVRLRKSLLDPNDREVVEKTMLDMIAKSECQGQELEARYAMAELSRLRDHFGYALGLVDDAEQLHERRKGSKEAFERLGARIADEGLDRMNRNRNWVALLDFYKQFLRERPDRLAPSSVRAIAEVLGRAGLHTEAAELLRATLKRDLPGEDVESLTLDLARSYLAAKKTYLTEVVLDFFQGVKSQSKRLWQINLVRAELLLRQRNGVAALDALNAADKSTPSGDPRARHALLKAEAEFYLGRADAAADSLLTSLQGEWQPPLETRGVAVNVMSLCARECSKTKLERLLKAIQNKGRGDLVSDRIRYLSANRGIDSSDKLGDESVWKRLEAAVPGVRLAPRAPLSGESR